MGSWDVYCAICGATVQWTGVSPEELKDMAEDDRQSAVILQKEKTDWLNRFRCIGENPDSASIDKVFVSGPAEYSDYGYCHLQPPDEKSIGAEGLESQIPVYSWASRDQEPLAFPCHDACLYTLLERAVSYVSGSESDSKKSLDKDIFHRALQEFGTSSSDNYGCYLDRIDYGEAMMELHGQFWYIIPGVESYNVDPVDIPALQEYYSRLPRVQSSSSSPEKSESRVGSNATKDIFSQLPLELVQHVVQYLPTDSMHALQAVSPSAAKFTATNRFWRERVVQDMPWLYDLPQKNNMDLDWSRIYTELMAKSDNDNNIEDKILGLVNRRRIWGLCEQFAESYIELKQAKDNQKHSPVLDRAVSERMIQVGQIEGAKFEMSKLALLDSIEDVGKHESTVQVHWTRNGHLLGFSVKIADSTQYHLGASHQSAERSDSVHIPQGDWLRGFVFVTSRDIECTYLCEDDIGRAVVGVEILFEYGEPVLLGKDKGDRRLATVDEGQLLVGLLAEWTPSIGIVRLSLLRHALKTVPSSRKANVWAHKSLGSVLWRHALPPPHLILSNPRVGYWSCDFSVDLDAHYAVVFGQDEAELARLTSIAIDAQFGGYELRYSDGTTKAFGPQRWAMSTLSIDGPSGERVTAVFTNVITHPTGLRLLTNRNRQLTVGPSLWPEHNSSRVVRSSASETLCGLACSWTPGKGDGQARLESLGTLSFPASAETNSIVYDDDNLGPRDAALLWWEPSAPPASWREDGPVYGKHEHRTRWRTMESKPGECDVAYWLDLTRRVDTVRVTFTHVDRNRETNSLSLVRITIEYTDGTQISAGPSDFTGYREKRESCDDGLPWCWCHYGYVDKKDLAQAPHYRHEEFAVSGDYIQVLRVWTRPWLAGIQLVSAGGVEGPVWGEQKGEQATIIFDGEKQVGLKVAFSDNARATTYSDRIVMGMQALVRG